MYVDFTKRLLLACFIDRGDHCHSGHGLGLIRFEEVTDSTEKRGCGSIVRKRYSCFSWVDALLQSVSLFHALAEDAVKAQI
jgi:hypothetical protein